MTVVPAFPSKRSGFGPSLDVDNRSSLVSSRKVHAWRARTSEGGKTSETLRCLVDVGVETETDAGGKVVSEFVGKGEGVDVAVVMAGVRIVADVDTFGEDEGTANGLENKKVEEDGIVPSGIPAREWTGCYRG